jgi:hypothetical protein
MPQLRGNVPLFRDMIPLDLMFNSLIPALGRRNNDEGLLRIKDS